MINFRYHVVSITAVFLALALGLTLGSTFLDRATVNSLSGQLESLERDLDASGQQISDLEAQVAEQEEAAALFAEQGVGPLLDSELADVPLIVVVPQGTDEALVDRTLSTLAASGAEIPGTWTATERFALDDEAERRDLANVLGMETDLEGALRRTASQRLATVFLDRMEPVVALGAEPTATTTAAPSTDTTEVGAPPEGEIPVDTLEVADPLLLGDLVTAGFLEFRPIGDDSATVTLPADSARLVIIADTNEVLTPEQFILPMVENLTIDGPASVVVATGVDRAADAESRAEMRGAIVDLVRGNPRLSDRLSTVDNLETFAGRVALVLATGQVSQDRISHYGTADSASRLLPASDGPT